MAQYTINTAFIFFKVQDSFYSLVIFEMIKLEHFHTKIKEPGVLVTSTQLQELMWCSTRTQQVLNNCWRNEFPVTKISLPFMKVWFNLLNSLWGCILFKCFHEIFTFNCNIYKIWKITQTHIIYIYITNSQKWKNAKG